jgi:hypothetical protein
MREAAERRAGSARVGVVGEGIIWDVTWRMRRGGTNSGSEEREKEVGKGGKERREENRRGAMRRTKGITETNREAYTINKTDRINRIN